MIYRFIENIPPELHQPAWQQLLADRSPEAEASLRLAFAAEVEPFDGAGSLVLTAMRDNAVVGTMAALRQPGRVALCWPPRMSAATPREVGTELLARLLDRLHEDGVQLVQAFPDVPGDADRQLLTAAGFEHVADLRYMVCCQFPTAPPQFDAALETYSAANHQRLLKVLDRTYEGTLDCPRLNGVRQAEDALATYRGTSGFDPARWLLVRSGETDVGCLLLADHPTDEQWELVYVGLIPEARGGGLGRQLVRQAQWQTGQAGRHRLVLSVDANNAPAVGLYASEGFLVWDTRPIYLHILR